MIYLYKSVNPRKNNPPKVVFCKASVNGQFYYEKFGGLKHPNDVWSTGVGSVKGIIAELCPLDLSEWSQEDESA